MNMISEISEHLTELSEKGDFSGAVLLRQGEQTLLESAYGFANRSWQVPNTPTTRFRIASISKMFTAVAVLQLIEAGALSLETRIVDYLGLSRSSIPRVVSIYHLLTMTSGIADWFEESENWETEWNDLIRTHPIYLFRRNEDYLPLFIHKEPHQPPGEGYRYNGAGYILLALAIQKADQEDYFESVRRRVFNLVGMEDSDFLALDGVDKWVAEGYLPLKTEDQSKNSWRKNIYSTTPEAAGDGGATSTLADLAKFSQALRSGKLLSKSMTAQMLAPKVLQLEEKIRGYTWMYGYANNFILDENGGMVRWGHTGEEDGVSCRLYYYPEKNLNLIILGNQSWCAGKLGWHIHDILLNSPEI